jgi:hypothetical protein
VEFYKLCWQLLRHLCLTRLPILSLQAAVAVVVWLHIEAAVAAVLGDLEQAQFL